MYKTWLFEECLQLATQMLFTENQIITLETYTPLYDLVLYKFLLVSE